MALITIVPFIAFTVLTAALLNNAFNAILNQANGNLDETNIKDGSITSVKLAAGSIDLSSASITGNLSVIHLNNGTNANINTFWRGDGTWATPPATFPNSLLTGFIISNNAVDLVNDFDFTLGKCRNDADTFNIEVAALTKRIDANFSQGNNGGMLDTGTIGAVADLIYFFAIDDSAGVNAGDILASKSRTAPTMPVGYDIKRLIGHRRWNGASWDLFITYGKGIEKYTYLFLRQAILVNGSDTIYTDVNASAFVDGNVAGIAHIAFIGTTNSTVIQVYVRPNGSSGDALIITQNTVGPNAQCSAPYLSPIDTLSIFEYKEAGNGARTVDIDLIGFVENL